MTDAYDKEFIDLQKQENKIALTVELSMRVSALLLTFIDLIYAK